MDLQIYKCNISEIQHLRVLFLHQHKLQFIYDKCHLYGWADHYIIKKDTLPVGYGCVWGKDKREDRDTIFEFYLLKPFRNMASAIFPQFQCICKAPFIKCQSNDILLSEMMFEYAHQICSEAILFKDKTVTNFEYANASIRPALQEKVVNASDIQYELIWEGETVATGGFMLNYNMPFADLYYEVKEPYRKKGLGTFFIQQLKKEIYTRGRVPAARCNINNKISKASLLKAGLVVCGHVLTGEIKR